MFTSILSNFFLYFFASELNKYNFKIIDLNNFKQEEIKEWWPNYTATFWTAEVEEIWFFTEDIIKIKIKNYKNHYFWFYKEEKDKIKNETEIIEKSNNVFLIPDSRKDNEKFKTYIKDIKVWDKIIFYNKNWLEIDFYNKYWSEAYFNNLEISNIPPKNKNEIYIKTDFFSSYTCKWNKFILNKKYFDEKYLWYFIWTFFIEERPKFKNAFRKIMKKEKICE